MLCCSSWLILTRSTFSPPCPPMILFVSTLLSAPQTLYSREPSVGGLLPRALPFFCLRPEATLAASRFELSIEWRRLDTTVSYSLHARGQVETKECVQVGPSH